jgi:hypothetical protein
MKQALKVSLLLNLLLAGWIAWLNWHPPKSESPKSPDTLSAINRELAQRVEDQPPPAKKFRWSQLESTDYRQYINNLRAIGCPRQTIRDIITADVHSLYAARGEQSGHEPLQAQIRAAKLLALRAEENSVLLALLGPQPAGDISESARATRAQAQNNNVSIPLAYRPIDFSALNLNEDQLESVQYLRNAFQRELRDPGYDRSSPEYARQWQSAQAQSDLMLRGMLGTKLYDQIESSPQTGPNGPR